jgi:hypothetical protein
VCRCVGNPPRLAPHLGDKVGQQLVIIFGRGSAERVHQPARPAATTSLRGDVGGEAITITVSERLVCPQAVNEAISVRLVCVLNEVIRVTLCGPNRAFVGIPPRAQSRFVALACLADLSQLGRAHQLAAEREHLAGGQ